MAKSSKTTRSAGRPAGSDRLENLKRIIDAAMSIFARKGYAATNFADISEAVGFTRSAIYQYFPNKTELYRAVLTSIQQERREQLESTIADDAPFAEKLEKVLATFVSDHTERPELSMFLSAVPIEMARYPELAGEYEGMNAIPGLLIDFFQTAIDNGDITDKFSPEDLLICFLGGAMGMSLFQHSIGVGRMDSASDVIIEMLNNRFMQE